MDAQHDTILTITLPSVGTSGSIVVQRGDLAQIIEFDSTLRSAIEEAIDCALVALEEVQLNPPPAFPEPKVEAKTPAPKVDKPKKDKPAKKDPKPKTEKKQAKPKLDAVPTTAPAPRVEETKPAPVTEKPTEAKPKFEQLTLF